MESIINNSRTDIQVYHSCSNDANFQPPKLEDLTSDMLFVIGTNSSSDVPICDGEYDFLAVWNANERSGKPDSWIVYKDAKEESSSISKYSMEAKGNLITVSNNSEATGDNSGNGTNIWIIIIPILVFLLVFLGGGAIVFFMMNRQKGTAIGQDLPIFIPQ